MICCDLLWFVVIMLSCCVGVQTGTSIAKLSAEVPILVTYLLMPARELVLRPEMTIDTSAAPVFTVFTVTGKHWKNMKEHERTLNSERNCVYKALSWGTDMNWFSRFHAKAESEQLGWHQDAADRTFLEAWQSMTESMTKWTIKNSWEILNN